MNDLTQQKHELSTMTVDQLKQKLADLLRVTASTLLELAAVVRELEDRGEDLQSLKLGMVHWLRLIGSGQLLPEVVVRFQATPGVMKLIASLPLADQKRLADGGTVELLADASGAIRHVAPDAMTRDEVHQAFTSGHIRTLSEQRGIIDSRVVKKRAKPTPDDHGVILDRRRNVLKLSDGTEITRAQLLDYLRRLED